MLKAGIVAVDRDGYWAGGRYYLQHIIKSVAALPEHERVSLCDVWWMDKPDFDPFEEVRDILSESVIVSPPMSFLGRAIRKMKRLLLGVTDARDLIAAHDIDVFFPKPPSENLGTPYVFWLPDFQHRRRPDLLSKELCQQFERSFDEHVHKAQSIVLSSQDAQNDFAEVYPNHLDRTHVVRFCSVPDQNWWDFEPASVTLMYRLPERFFIVCNQFTRHKNHLTIMHAIQALTESGYDDVHLVCTGSIEDYRHEDYIGQVRSFLKEHALEDRVHILGMIPRGEQIALLRQSLAVLQPSWFEGWSTIIEDAKTLGKPTLASDLPVNREQLLDIQDEFLPLDDPKKWAEAMQVAWDNLEPGVNETQEAEGMARLQIAQRECGLAFVRALKSAL